AAFDALAPSFQFRSDTVSLAGGNVTTIPNRKGSDALVIAAGTLAAPAPDALFGGAPSIVFSAAQYLDSNLAPLAWAFGSDGSGFEMFNVFGQTTVGATGTFCATTNAVSTSSKGFRFGTFSSSCTMIVGNGSLGIVN